MPGEQVGEGSGQQAADRAPHPAQSQRPEDLPVEGGQVGLGRVHLFEDTAGVPRQDPARVGEPHAPPLGFQQALAGLPLQLGELL